MQAWVDNLSADQRQALTQQISRGALFGRAQAMLDDFDPSNRAIALPPPPEEPMTLTLTIELQGPKPRIWRRLVLPGDLTLDVVHTLFQAAMGWTDSHLHRFQPSTPRGKPQDYFITEFDEQEGDEGTPEKDVRLDQVLCERGDRLTYLYDFGDDWEHLVKLESIQKQASGDRVEPRCVAGARACPPEDVGGIWAFEELAAWIEAGAPPEAVPSPFEDADHAHGWLPNSYDPDAFDAAEATAAMRLWAAGEHLPWHGLPEPLVKLITAVRSPGWMQVSAWLEDLGSRSKVELDEQDVLAGARPWVVMLEAVSPETKLTAAGYLPPVMVQRIAEQLGLMRGMVGNATREEQVWPVADLREASQKVGLLRKAKGTLTPTVRARAVADNPRALVETVLARLPLGKGFPEEAGWFALLGLAAGVSGADLDEGIARILGDRGWRTRGSSGVGVRDARAGARATIEALDAMAGGFEALNLARRERLARAVLFGVADPG